MFRFVFLNAFIVIHTCIFCLLAIIFSFFDHSKRLVRFYVAMPWARTILWVCGIKVTVKGQERVRDRIPTIFMCNHQSYFDIFALLAYLPADFKFILKQELMRIPLFGIALKRAGYISIKREHPRDAIRSLESLAEKIRTGTSVLVFPEGTRSVDGKLLPFKKGGFQMALKSGCQIVPIAISNSCRIVQKGSFKINKGAFTIHFGDPISLQEYKKKDLAALRDRVKAAISALSEEPPAREDDSNGM